MHSHLPSREHTDPRTTLSGPRTQTRQALFQHKKHAWAWQGVKVGGNVADHPSFMLITVITVVYIGSMRDKLNDAWFCEKLRL